MQSLSDHAATLTPPVGQTMARSLGAIALCGVLGGIMLLLGQNIGDFQERLLQQIGVFIIAAVSLTIVNGFTGQFSMGNAGFMAVGGYVAAATSYYGNLLYGGVLPPAHEFLNSGHVFMLLGILLGAIVAAVLGLLVGLPSLRLRGDYLAIVTLGFGEIVRVILQLTGSQLNTADAGAVEAFRQDPLNTLAGLPVGGSLGFTSIPPYASNLYIWTFVAITILFAVRVKASSTGRAFLSIREDEIAARSMGINLTKYKVRAFTLAAFFAGIAGGLLAHAAVPLQPQDAGFQRSFEIIIMVVLGGLGSVSGAVIAAIVLTILPEALRFLAEYRLILYAALLITVMLVRPQGLMGTREIWEIGPFSRRAKRGERSEAKRKAGAA
jgi:branched-chain amino acid transport system permease protein